MKTNLDKNQKVATSRLVRVSLITLGLLASLFVAGPAAAASACKGLENSACNSNASCGWVDSYQRKDGRTVKSFCRTKAVSKSSTTKRASTKKANQLTAKK